MATIAPEPEPGRRRRYRWLALGAASVGGALLVSALGWQLLAAAIVPRAEDEERSRVDWLIEAAGKGLGRLSYDLLFLLRPPAAVPEARIVWLDERSGGRLEQKGGVWDRSVHTRLVQRLTRDGARLVFFDIVFPDEWPDPAVDDAFAQAIQENGHVFLGAALEFDYGAGALQERTIPPTARLRRAAAGWGLIAFRPVDPDYGVRQIYTGMDLVPSATWRAALHAGAPLPTSLEGRLQERWLNYYGRADCFDSVSYDRALFDEETPPGFFRDKYVFIGGRSTLGTLMLGKDDFRTPFGLFGAQFARGVELHLTVFLNLLRGEWLTRLAPRHELWLVLLCGLLLGGGLPYLRPVAATAVTALALVALVAVAVWSQVERQVWFAWAVPALVQAPVALGWAVGARYFVEERRRRRLLDAFGHYLSPQMAERIADADFDLTPGGKVVTATVMFTDLENYSGLCERLDDPQSIVRVLNAYYTRTIGHILGNDGTVIKYMGDAVQAVWGTPLPDRDQMRKAVRAAWQMHLASREPYEGHSLRTRIGLNCAEVLAGNLGSAERFDFAVIGSPVNLASRFEGLNKYLGTDILISESIAVELSGEFETRRLGLFRVVGTEAPQKLHEVLGPAGKDEERPWLEGFARGLAAFQRADWDGAEREMRAVSTARPGGDGPAAFYLARIAELRGATLPPGWGGVVEFTSK